jgi:hypothetical protein
MSFKRINENYFIIDESGEKLSIKIEKILWHHCAFSLIRESETKEKVNLFSVLNDIKDIVILYTNEKPEIHDIFLQFLNNDRIDKKRWIDICEAYLKRQNVSVTRVYDIMLVFRILK